MSNKELKELMSIICEGQGSEQRRKVENFIEYQVQLIDSLDKEIERLKLIIAAAIRIYENCEETQDYSTCDLDMYECLKKVYKKEENKE